MNARRNFRAFVPLGAHGRAAMFGLLTLACAIPLLPLLAVDVPPLLDYPNHLARAWVLARLATDPLLATMFQTHWAPIPNLASDLLLPPLIGPLPVYVAGRLMLAVILVLPVLGCAAYARMLFGRVTVWSAGSALVTTHGLFLLGFLNFCFSVGLALLAAAGWGALRPRLPRAAAAFGAVLTAALFFSHLMGLVLFLLLSGCLELDRALAPLTSGQTMWRRLGGLAAALAPLAVPAVLLYRLTALEGRPLELGWTKPWAKLGQLALPVINYDPWLDALAGAAILAVVAAGLLGGRGRLPRSTLLAIGLLGALYAVLPFAMKGTGFLDARLPVMIGFVVFAGIAPGPLPFRTSRLAGLALAGLLLVRTAEVARVWHAHGEDIASLREVAARIEPGSSVFLASVSPGDAPALWRAAPPGRMLSNGQRLDAHMAALLLIEKHAAWPFFFADPSQQPVSFAGRYAEAARRTPQLPDYADVAAAFAGDARLSGPAASLIACGGCFDYLLLFEAGYRPGFPGLPPDRLQLVAANGFAALFRIVPSLVVAAIAMPDRSRH